MSTQKKVLAILLIPMQFIIMFILDKVRIPIDDFITYTYTIDFIARLIPFTLLMLIFSDIYKKDWQRLSLSKLKLVLSIVLGVIGIQIVAFVTASFVNNYEPIESVTLTNPTILLIVLSLSSVLTAVTEEFVFRYFMLTSFHRKRMISWLLYIASSVLFGLGHYFGTGNLEGTVPYIFVGFLLGAIYIKTKNLWYTTLIHVVNNFIYGTIPLIILYLQ